MTMFSANTFVVWGGMTYEHGIVAIMMNLCYGVAALLAGYTVAGKWKRLSVRTPAEYIERRFGNASGNGIFGFMVGAAFRMGAESKEEFGEGFAPNVEYGQLLGLSMYFTTKDVGVPVKFTAPSWALKDITKIPCYCQFKTNMLGCNFWWHEYDGRVRIQIGLQVRLKRVHEF